MTNCGCDFCLSCELKGDATDNVYVLDALKRGLFLTTNFLVQYAQVLDLAEYKKLLERNQP